MLRLVGWYRMSVLDGPTPLHAKWVRVGGDPAGLSDWPDAAAFKPLPGLGPVNAPNATNATALRAGQIIARRFSG
jgi:hypothetical protein